MKKSNFSKTLIQLNGLDKRGFKEWSFYPGMRFGSWEKWWGKGGKRETPHEGVDLCLYKDQEGQIHRLDETTKIPMTYDGKVVKITQDFLGQSIYVEHAVRDLHKNRLLTFYGHTTPYENIDTGKILSQGDIIGTVADTSKKKLKIFPHLHISFGWVSEKTSYEELDWSRMWVREIVVLVDPSDLIQGI